MSNCVRQRREALNIELDEFAAAVGVSARYLFALEEDVCSVSVDVALRIAKLLNASVEQLFDAEGGFEDLRKDAACVGTRDISRSEVGRCFGSDAPKTDVLDADKESAEESVRNVGERNVETEKGAEGSAEVAEKIVGTSVGELSASDSATEIDGASVAQASSGSRANDLFAEASLLGTANSTAAKDSAASAPDFVADTSSKEETASEIANAEIEASTEGAGQKRKRSSTKKKSVKTETTARSASSEASVKEKTVKRTGSKKETDSTGEKNDAPAIAPYKTALESKTLEELWGEEKDSAPAVSLFETTNAESSDEISRRVYAPRNSQKISSESSRTSKTHGLADSPEGLADAASERPIRYFDLFCGIGGFRYAARNTFAQMGRESECVLSCDIDIPAQESYAANFGDRPYGDVSRLPSEEIPDFDLLTAGFPCQTFSIIGLRKGFADETKGSLFFQIARILKDKRPRAFVLENVRQLTTHDSGRTFEIILRVLQEELGYYVDWRVLNALDCGLPQKRERVVVVGSTEPFEMEWPLPDPNPKTLSDVLEDDKDVPARYFASAEIVAKRKSAHTSAYFPAIWHENKSGNISSYPYSCALRAGASYNYLLVNGERRLTPREMLRLQGFPDDFKIVVSDTQIRKQAGNAAPVNLIQAAMERFLPLTFKRK